MVTAASTSRTWPLRFLCCGRPALPWRRLLALPLPTSLFILPLTVTTTLWQLTRITPAILLFMPSMETGRCPVLFTCLKIPCNHVLYLEIVLFLYDSLGFSCLKHILQI